MQRKTSDRLTDTVVYNNSVLLVSPNNEILLLHRVQTSSSFPSAHVFPGGNLSEQDGENDPRSHEDAPCYRRAAIRELFEESGILLARNANNGKLLAVGQDMRTSGRKAVHMNELTFTQWLKTLDSHAEPDTGSLEIVCSFWERMKYVMTMNATQVD